VSEIDARMVKELREKTGAGMMDCKKALAEAGGDFARAAEVLRKRGIASAEKRAGRAARQGLVAVCVSGGCAGLVEVNCETDFVARTPFFGEFASGLASLAAKGGAIDAGCTSEVTAKVGENVRIGRYANLAAGHGARSVIGSYIHIGGRIGVLVELAAGKEPADKAALSALAEDVAMQVAAARPLCVRRAEVPDAVVEKEKEIYRAQAAESKKPANVVERIVEGKLEKFFQENCLEEQGFIKDPSGKLAVKAHLAAAGAAAGAGAVTIVRFFRYEVGEGQDAASAEATAPGAAAGECGA
jgi:elongation factor Ts